MTLGCKSTSFFSERDSSSPRSSLSAVLLLPEYDVIPSSSTLAFSLMLLATSNEASDDSRAIRLLLLTEVADLLDVGVMSAFRSDGDVPTARDEETTGSSVRCGVWNETLRDARVVSCVEASLAVVRCRASTVIVHQRMSAKEGDMTHQHPHPSKHLPRPDPRFSLTSLRRSCFLLSMTRLPRFFHPRARPNAIVLPPP